MSRLGFVFLASAFLIACTESPDDADDASTAAADRVAIDRGHEAFLAGMRASDCSALIPLLTESVVFAPPNTPTVTGTAGVRAWCEPIFMQMKTTAVSVSDRDVILAGDWAIEHGNYAWTLASAAGGSEVREQGRFVAIYQRQPDGAWKLARDIWNSSLPLPAAQGR